MQQPGVLGTEGLPFVQADSCCDAQTGECSNAPGSPGTVAAPVRAVRAGGCCGGGGELDETPFEERLQLGARRRVLVRRVALAGSGLSVLVALVVTGAGGSPALADRFAWLAVVWAAGPILGWVRTGMTTRRVDSRLVVVAASVAAGIAWQPLVPGLVAVALLAERAVRPPRPVAGGARASAPVVGQPG
jgi:hypothetical protein